MGAQLSRDEMLDEVYVTAVAETAKRIEKDMHESGTVVSYSAAIESFLRNRNATLKARHHFPGLLSSKNWDVLLQFDAVFIAIEKVPERVHGFWSMRMQLL